MEMKNVKLAIVDNDLSNTSRQLVSKFDASPFFKLQPQNIDLQQAEQTLALGNIDAYINIPSGFERKLNREGGAKAQVIINAINGVTAGITNAYINGIIAGYNIEVRNEINGKSTIPLPLGSINIDNSYWYNPQLNYKNFMVPAVLVILVTMIGLFLSSMNLVREKEMGTIEQINVSPIKKYEFIAGKLIPFWLLALAELAFGLIVGKFLFNIPVVGSLWLLFGLASIYLIAVLGIGLLISAVSNTQQQAMFVTFFIVLVCIMMSGIFTAVESMPQWAQWLNKINPVYYFMRGVRMILLKGSEFKHLIAEFISLLVYALVILRLAVWKYKKTVE
jgi:ABC-2 type transport system permease protein